MKNGPPGKLFSLSKNSTKKIPLVSYKFVSEYSGQEDAIVKDILLQTIGFGKIL